MIQLLYKNAECPDIDMPGHIIIEAEHARHHACHCTNFSKEAQAICKQAYERNKLVPPPTTHVQIIGFVDMTWKLWQRGHSVQWRYPESGLHPKFQLVLGDVLILLDQERRRQYEPYLKEAR